MNKLLIVLFVFSSITFPSHAQLVGTDVAPGDACIAGEINRTQMVSDPDGDGRGVILICDGSNWQPEKPTLVNACSDGDSITFDAASGGFACGVADTIDPVWITAAGIIATTNVNLAISQVVAASDESGTPAYTKVSGAGWLVVATDGTVTGRAPASGGTYSIAVRATDGSGNSADRTFNVVVNSGSGPAGCVNPGDICPDLTIYVGESPDGNNNYFTTQANLPGSYAWNDDTSNFLDNVVTNCTNVESTCRTGQSNTNALMLADSATTTAGIDPHHAARACFCLGESHANAPNGSIPSECTGDPQGTNALDGYGYDDWYLPSIAELDVMYVNLASPGDTDNPTYQDGVGGGNGVNAGNDGPAAGSFGTAFYWSSSERNNVASWLIQYSDGWLFHSNFSQNKSGNNSVRCVRR